MWFEKLTGFKEENPAQVRNNLLINGDKLISKVNGAEYRYGKLDVIKLEDLRNNVLNNTYRSKIKFSEVVGNIQALHKDKANNGAFFQAASQFNLLEMVGPNITPEKGVGIYENDYTQGPACAIACGAGTIFRNYFVNIDSQIGQSAHLQIDCLKDIGLELGNENDRYWKMSNGYALANDIEALRHISDQITSKSGQELEILKGKLRIGIQWDTEVTISGPDQIVSQAYCSALPVSYSPIPSEYWMIFARLILEATYEATLLAALMNYEKTGNNKVFLTLVGGGAFGNKIEWIVDAIRMSVLKFSNTPLDVKIVSYGVSNPHVSELIK
jgi:hypothetical protein